MANESIPPGAELVVEARLLDPGVPVPRPGYIYAIGLMRYQVLRILEGHSPSEILLVGHDNPDLNDPRFRPGVLHRLRLTRDFPEHASLVNPFGDRLPEEGAFFCKSFEVVQEP